MSSLAMGDRLRLVVERASRIGRRVKPSSLRGVWPTSSGGVQLQIAPPDLRTSDPTIADDIYVGRFTLAGRSADTQGHSVFEIIPPTADWERALHGFGWLRHLRAADTPLARSNASVIVTDWLRLHGRTKRNIAWEPEIAARRAMAFMSQSPLILSEADHELYRTFVKSLIKHGAYLSAAGPRANAGIPRIRSAIATALIGLSLTRQDRFARVGLEQLDSELDAQILPDGGHISRDPAALVEVLVDLLPLRQALISRGQTPSSVILGSVDKMMPMLRFFRHRDGGFTQFNGAAASTNDLSATILAYDETNGKPLASAPYSGYERIERGKTLLVVDAGPPPPLAYSGTAHAGTMSFELSSGNERIIINCGAPSARHGDWRKVARMTAAHSTAGLDDMSSCRFASPEPDAVIVSGPRNMVRERAEELGGSIRLDLSHDGYERDLGIVHVRHLTLSGGGEELVGQDHFVPRRSDADATFAIRFHLHPMVDVQQSGEGNALILALRQGERWRMECDLPVHTESSVDLSDVYGSRATKQIVVTGSVRQIPVIGWRIVRLN